MLRKTLNILWKVLAGLIFLLLLLYALIQLPAIQKKIVTSVIENVKQKTGANIQLKKVYLSIPKSITFQELLIEDQRPDTLLFIEKGKIDISLFSLLNNKIKINALSLTGLKSQVYRGENSDAFNFQFLLDGLNSENQNDTVASEPMQFDIKYIHLKNHQISYHDSLTQQYHDLILGKFELDIDELALAENQFSFPDISLENTSYSVQSYNPDTSSIEISKETNAILPVIDLEDINIENVSVTFQSNSLSFQSSIAHAYANPSLVDLNKQKIIINTIEVNKSTTGLILEQGDSTTIESPNEKGDWGQTIFGQIGWHLASNELKMKNSSFKMDIKGAPQLDVFDHQHMDIHQFNVVGEHVLFSDSLITANILHLSANESNRINLNDFKANCRINPQGMWAYDVLLQTDDSEIIGELGISYEHIFSLTDHPGDFGIIAKIQPSTIGTNDALYFIPYFKEREVLQKLENKKASFRIDLDGNMDNLSFVNSQIELGDELYFHWNGTLKGLPEIENIQFDFDTLEAHGKDALLSSFLADSTYGGKIPMRWQLSGSLAGNTSFIQSNISFQSSLGDVLAIGTLNMDSIERDSTDFTFQAKELALGSILGNSMLGDIDFETHVIAKNNFTKNGVVNGEISNLKIKDQQYEGIDFKVLLDHDTKINLSSSDPKAKFNVDANYFRKDSSQFFTFNMDIHHLALQNLLESEEGFNLTSNVNADYSLIKGKGFNGQMVVDELTIIKDSVIHKLGDIVLNSEINKNNVDFTIQSNVINGYLKGNTSLDEFQLILNNQFAQYLSDLDTAALFNEKYIDFNLQFKDTEIITNAFFNSIETLEISKFEGHYSGGTNTFKSDIIVPELNISGIIVNNLALQINSVKDSLLANVNIDEINYNDLLISKLKFNSQFKEDTIVFAFTKFDDKNSPQYYFHNYFIYSPENVALYIPDETLVWNYNTWRHQGNNILYLRDSIDKEVAFIYEDQKIQFNSRESLFHLNLINFDISNFTHVIENSDSILPLNGILNGDIAFQAESPFLFDIDLDSDSLNFRSNDIGQFQLFATKSNEAQYKFGFTTQYHDNILKLRGNYRETLEDYSFNTNLYVNWKELSYFEQFIEDISNIKGEINGEANFAGSKNDFSSQGGFNLHNLSFISPYLNSTYRIPDGEISFNKFDAFFNDLKVLDQNGKPLTIDGGINYQNYPLLKYDLNIASEGFTFMNNTQKESDTFFGKLVVSSNFNLTGNSNKPILKSTIKIDPQSSLTYILPGQELELVSDEGIVVWGDADLPEHDQNMFGTDSINVLGDYYVSTFLKIDPGASFTLITDPNAGDIAKFNLDGNLNISKDASSKPVFTGAIEATNGSYELSFYGLVKKKFGIVPKSRVIWSGDVFDATLDIAARYGIKTNSAALIANETGGLEGGRYNQRIDYFITLQISGTVNNPELKFLLDLKDEYKNSYAVVANKLEQLNQPEFEAERNKQVFALLVAGNFITDTPVNPTGQSSNNFATSAARNSVNGILTQQLNNITGQYIKFVDFNMGVNTYENYSTGKSETRTDLDLQVSKKLFNDRVTVEVESSINLDSDASQNTTQSGKSTSFEYSVFYDLTPSGNYRIKAFRENAYDLFDGEIQNSGVAFIFIREFDSKKDKDSEPEKPDEKPLNPKEKNKEEEEE